MKEEEDGYIQISSTKGERMRQGIGTTATNMTLPNYILKLIDEEAKIKGKTRSHVAAYLILSGLKAHVGKFIPPNENTIRENYYKRGQKW